MNELQKKVYSIVLASSWPLTLGEILHQLSKSSETYDVKDVEAANGELIKNGLLGSTSAYFIVGQQM